LHTASSLNETNLFSHNDPCPQLVIIVKDKKYGLLGYLVIDSLVPGKCSGGIRMAPDISISEITHLARAMTLKFGFKNSFTGGAKAGIICPQDATEKQKQEILKSFGLNLGPILRTIYSPGGDIGIGPKELKIIKNAAGMDTKIRPATHKAGYFTAYGVFVSIKTVIRKLGLKCKDCKIAIAGYGNVGRPLARFLYQAGCKILAVSTIKAAIFNEDGLNIDSLEALANEYGDRTVQTYENGENIEKSDLFTLDVNIIIPGARPWSINMNNVDKIKANAIVPAANIPVTKEASEILYKKGIIYIPDFVSTGGGIMGCSLLNNSFEEKDVLNIMDKTFELKISKLMDLSNDKKVAIKDLAAQIAQNNFARLRKSKTLSKNKWKYFIAKIKEEKNIVSMLERATGRLYKKLQGRNFFLKNILKPGAVAHAYRNAVGDVKYYPE